MLSNREVVEKDPEFTPRGLKRDNLQPLHGKSENLESHPAQIGDTGSFQSFHERSQVLMNKGIEIQEAIRTNRNDRANSQKQLFRLYGEISQINPSVKQNSGNDNLLSEIKGQIHDLDTQHTSLNKEFVSIQSQILQTVRNQRIRLVKNGFRSTDEPFTA